MRANLCFNSYSPTLSHTYTQVNFHQFTTPEAPPCAAPLAGCLAVSVGYTLGPGPASDSPESLRTAHINLTGQTPGEESNSMCPEALPAENVLGLTTMLMLNTAHLQPILLPFPGQCLTPFQRDLVTLAIRVTGMFFFPFSCAEE